MVIIVEVVVVKVVEVAKMVIVVLVVMVAVIVMVVYSLTKERKRTVAAMLARVLTWKEDDGRKVIEG